jgi:ElaB/YqjD/DUF883 family membrane-anchored ribosome-binding protein
MANTTTFPTKDEARTSANKMRNEAEDMMDKAKDAAASTAEKAKNVASNAMSAVTDTADSAAAAVGGGMTSLAKTMREHAPGEGMLASATKSVAQSLESGGRYLKNEGVTGMAEDLGNMIRRNPFPAVLVGIGLGFLLARTLRS